MANLQNNGKETSSGYVSKGFMNKINPDLIATIVLSLCGLGVYLMNNQVILEKRLTTVEERSINTIDKLLDIKLALTNLDAKIDKLVESRFINNNGIDNTNK